jgi:putative sterol carrier protein
MNADTPTYTAAVAQLQAKLTPQVLEQVGAVYAFHFTDDGATATLDGSTARGLGYVEAAPADRGLAPDFEVTLTRDDFARLITGRMHPMAGMATGRMKLKGSMKEAIKLDRILKA